MARESCPGQFVHIRISDGPHPILRRPFSILSTDKDKLRILFKLVGEGTKILSLAKPGDILDIMGPLGTYFPMEGKPAVLIAGGIGMAPLYFLAQRIKKKNKRKVIFFYGARSKNDLVFTKEIAVLVDKITVTTDDGSQGKKGMITDLLDPLLKPDFSFYACGPEPMLIALETKLRMHHLSAWFSLENRMACGVGACQGCAVETRSGFRRVCVDGPVFSSDEIIALPFSQDVKLDVWQNH
jgi:dihydroorotate dehydrogenase electron transfer subunit